MSIKTNRAATSWRQSMWCLLVAVGLTACSQTPYQAPMDTAPSVPLAAAEPEPAPLAESTLGTQWGEERESNVRSVHTTRLSPDSPQAIAQMRYSDENSLRRALGRKANRQNNVLLAHGKVEWSVRDEQGRPLPIFSRHGNRDYIVAGHDGERYELVYVNRSNRTYEVIATVDGLDVITGQPGSVHNNGYILSPGETLRIDGFRKSQHEVAAFRFAAKDLAYANNTPAGDARNIGVIGSALFEVCMDGPDGCTRHSHHPRTKPSDRPNPFPGDPAGTYAPPPQYRR
ncbi:MAG: hypothetical protein FWD67_11450 [Betaproteobacteria bacterium]|nr:hypothetical protein [Betaproteobacteria bacterium]